MGIRKKAKALASRIVNSGKDALVNELQDTVQDWTDDINSRIAKQYQDMFGNSPTWADWVENPIKARLMSRLRASKNQNKRNDVYFKRYSDNIAAIYNDYWKERWSEIEAIYPWKQNTGDFASSKPYSQHHRFKKKNLGSSASHNNKPIKYTSPAMMTGFLKMSIIDSIRLNGNEFLEIYNDPLRVSYLFNPDAYPEAPGSSISYVEMFWSVIGEDDPQDIFNMPDKYWRRISAEIDYLAENNIIPSFNDAVRNR